MPEAFEKRPEAWQRLTTGNLVLRALRDAVRGGSVEGVERHLAGWLEFLEGKDEPYRTQRIVLSAALACARLALAGGQTGAELPTLLRRFHPAAEAPEGGAEIVLAPGESGWRQSVRDALLAMRWRDPFCAGWALDVLEWVGGTPRRAPRSQSVWALLAVDYGVPARLTVESIEDPSGGSFYPDPATMMFVVRDEAFRRAEQNAASLLRAGGLWPAGGGRDVRWRIERLDGRALAGLRGGSAGGAFALSLAKLFAE